MEGTWDQDGHTCTWNAATMVLTCDGEEVGFAESLKEAIIRIADHLGEVQPWLGTLEKESR